MKQDARCEGFRPEEPTTLGQLENAWSTRGRLFDTRTGGLSGPYKGEVSLGRACPGGAARTLVRPGPTTFNFGRARPLVDNSNLSTRHSRGNHVPKRTLGVPLLQVRNWTATPRTASQKGETSPTKKQMFFSKS